MNEYMPSEKEMIKAKLESFGIITENLEIN